MTVIGVTMVRDEADIIDTTIRHMVAHVDHIIVADNLSTDDTPKILRRLVDDGLPVTVQQDDNPAHQQGAKITGLAHQAARMGATWVVPFDADELWYPLQGATIKEALSALPVQVDVVAAPGFDHLGPALSPRRRRQHQPLPKVAFRARLDTRVGEGNHAVHPCHQPVEGVLAFRHFQYRSLEQMTRKVRQGTAALNAAEVPDDTGAHWKAGAALNDDELEAVWAGLCFEPGLVYDPAPLADPALPSVAVVIPTYNRAALLDQTLTAVRATTDDVPVIVVDNGSTDDTADVCKKHTVRTIRNDENLGFAVACNQGAKAAKTDRVVFLNNDTVPQPGWLTNLNRHPAGIVGANLVYPDGRTQHTGVYFRHRDDVLEAFNRTIPAPSALVPAVTGACMLVDKRLFDELGGFDDGFVNGYEDVDLCLRARKHGVDIAYAADSVVVHLESQTEGRFDHAPQNIERLHDRWGYLEV